MKKTLSEVMSCGLVTVGTAIGAGFATGRETAEYFSAFGMYGVWCAIGVMILFAFLTGLVAYLAKKRNCGSLWELFDILLPRGLSRVMEYLCIALLLVSFCIMITGCGTLVAEIFPVSVFYGGVICAGLCFVFIANKTRGLLLFHQILTPVIIGGMLFFILRCFQKTTGQPMAYCGKWSGSVYSSLLYVCCNFISVAAAMCPAGNACSVPKNAFWGGACGGGVFGGMLCLQTIVLTRRPDLCSMQMPFFQAIRCFFPQWTAICLPIMMFAMLTTAVSAGAGVCAKLPDKVTPLGALVLCGVSLGTCRLSFAVLVRFSYSVFGVAGAILPFAILRYFFKKAKIIRKSKKT